MRVRWPISHMNWSSAWRRSNSNLVEDACGKVTVAPVAHDEDDRGVLHATRYPQRCNQRPCRRDTAKDAFLGCQPARHLFGLCLRDGFEGVHTAGIVDARQVFLRPLPDTGNL